MEILHFDFRAWNMGFNIVSPTWNVFKNNFCILYNFVLCEKVFDYRFSSSNIIYELYLTKYWTATHLDTLLHFHPLTTIWKRRNYVPERANNFLNIIYTYIKVIGHFIPLYGPNVFWFSWFLERLPWTWSVSNRVFLGEFWYTILDR